MYGSNFNFNRVRLKFYNKSQKRTKKWKRIDLISIEILHLEENAKQKLGFQVMLEGQYCDQLACGESWSRRKIGSLVLPGFTRTIKWTGLGDARNQGCRIACAKCLFPVDT